MSVNNDNTNCTILAKSKETTTKKVLETVWQVFKGLFIAAVILAVIFNTFVSIDLIRLQQQPIMLNEPYYHDTQDWLDLLEAVEKDPNSTKTDEMRMAFYKKYSIPYKNTVYYEELRKLHEENPDSDEYKKALKKFQEVYDIAEEDISFDE